MVPPHYLLREISVVKLKYCLAAAIVIVASIAAGEQPPAPKSDAGGERTAATKAAILAKLSDEAKSWVAQGDDWPADSEGKRTLDVWDEDGKIEIKEGDLAALRLLPKVNSLCIATNFSESGFAELRGLRNIEYIDIGTDVLVTDKVAADFATMSNLRTLSVWQSTYHPDEKLTYFDDEGLSALRKLKRLKSLTLYNVAITASGMQVLKDFPELREFRVGSTKLTWSDLARIPRMSKLDTLEFGAGPLVPDNSDIEQSRSTVPTQSPREKKVEAALLKDGNLSPTAVGWLKHHTEWPVGPDLTRWLVISPTDKVADGDLAALSAMADVTQLWIKHAFTDAGLANLRGLGSVVYLSIGPDVHLTDRALTDIATMENLRELEIIQTPRGPNESRNCIDDAGLATLSRLPKLRVLKMRGVSITNAGLSKLKDFPKLRELRMSSSKLTWDCLANFPLPRSLITLELSCPPAGPVQAAR